MNNAIQDKFGDIQESLRDIAEYLERIEEEKTVMETTNQEISPSLNFSEDEIKRATTWAKLHWEKFHKNSPYGGADGGSFCYKIIPTSLGIAKEVQCSCGKLYTIKKI